MEEAKPEDFSEDEESERGDQPDVNFMMDNFLGSLVNYEISDWAVEEEAVQDVYCSDCDEEEVENGMYEDDT